MTERMPEAAPPRSMTEPVEPTGEVARKNIRLGIALAAIAFLMVAGTVAVSLIYLHYA